MSTISIHNDEIHLVDDDNATIHIIPLQAIATWGALLKYHSDEETLQAILTAKDPGVIDEATGENAWTAAYQQLRKDTTGEQQDESAIDGSTQARYNLGLSQPRRKTRSNQTIIMNELTEILAAHADQIDGMRAEFLASLNPNNINSTD